MVPWWWDDKIIPFSWWATCGHSRQWFPQIPAAARGDGGYPGISTWEQDLGTVGISLLQHFASCAVCTSRLCSTGSVGAVPGRGGEERAPRPPQSRGRGRWGPCHCLLSAGLFPWKTCGYLDKKPHFCGLRALHQAVSANLTLLLAPQQSIF